MRVLATHRDASKPSDCEAELGVRDRENTSTSTFNFDSNILVGYGGRLLYLKGYRDGSKEKRVELLKKAIEFFRY